MESRRDTYCVDDVRAFHEVDGIFEHEYELLHDIEEERPGRKMRDWDRRAREVLGRTNVSRSSVDMRVLH